MLHAGPGCAWPAPFGRTEFGIPPGPSSILGRRSRQVQLLPQLEFALVEALPLRAGEGDDRLPLVRLDVLVLLDEDPAFRVDHRRDVDHVPM
jgi:hypothetical protein